MRIDNPSLYIGIGNDPTVSPIPVLELTDGYDPSIGDQGGQLVKKYLCNFPDAYRLANQLMGLSTAAMVAGTITRQLPHRCPEFPALLASSVEVEPAGLLVVTGGRPTWSEAIVKVVYKPWAFAGGGDPDQAQDLMMSPDGENTYDFCTINIDYAQEIVKLPATSYKIVGTSTPYGEPLQLRLGAASIQLTLHDIPYFPFALLKSLLNKVNSTTFLGIAAGQCLYTGARTHQKINNVGQRSMDIDLNFKYRDEQFNNVPDPRPGRGRSFILITDDGTITGDTLFDAGDLRPLVLGVTLS